MVYRKTEGLSFGDTVSERHYGLFSGLFFYKKFFVIVIDMYTLIGLGNPGSEYENTRHNAGRMALMHFTKKENLPEWELDKKYQSLKTGGTIKKNKFTCLLPETFMNKSGSAVKFLEAKSYKLKANVVVLHDDIDIPLGKFKLSFGRGSGGHKGVESIMRTLHTKDFIRIRIGIAHKKKPSQKDIPDFILKKFQPKEVDRLKKVFRKTTEALEMIITEGLPKAMNMYN